MVCCITVSNTLHVGSYFDYLARSVAQHTRCNIIVSTSTQVIEKKHSTYFGSVVLDPYVHIPHPIFDFELQFLHLRFSNYSDTIKKFQLVQQGLSFAILRTSSPLYKSGSLSYHLLLYSWLIIIKRRRFRFGDYFQSWY